MQVFVEGIGLIAPGLEGWTAARAVLAGNRPYQCNPLRPPQVELLPPAERRRAGLTIKLAIAAGIEALQQAKHDPADMAMVFTASGGDGETIHAILSVLATDQREVSPTRFHNSVHNAPAIHGLLGCCHRVARAKHEPERVRQQLHCRIARSNHPGGSAEASCHLGRL